MADWMRELLGVSFMFNIPNNMVSLARKRSHFPSTKVGKRWLLTSTSSSRWPSSVLSGRATGPVSDFYRGSVQALTRRP